MYSTYLHWKLSFFHYIMSLSDLQKLLRELTEISQNFRKQNYLMLINKSYYIQWFSQKKNQKDSDGLQHWKRTLKIQILGFLRRSLIILVALTMTWYSEEMIVSTTLRSLIQGEAVKKGRQEFFFKFDKRVGSNNSKEDGRNFICVGEKQKGWKFSWILINGEAQITVGRMENFPEN